MFGTVYRMKPKAGETQAVIDMFRRWRQERGPKAKGAIASYAVHNDGGDIMGVAVFADEATYRANASDPEQDAWYRQLRSHLQADPEWYDGVIEGGAL